MATAVAGGRWQIGCNPAYSCHRLRSTWDTPLGRWSFSSQSLSIETWMTTCVVGSVYNITFETTCMVYELFSYTKTLNRGTNATVEGARTRSRSRVGMRSRSRMAEAAALGPQQYLASSFLATGRRWMAAGPFRDAAEDPCLPWMDRHSTSMVRWPVQF